MTLTRRIIVLGSTGSIGVNTLNVINHLNHSSQAPRFEVVGLSAGQNAKRLAEQTHRFNVPNIALADTQTDNTLFPNEAQIYTGPNAVQQLIEKVEADIVVAAMVGSDGLRAVWKTIEKGTQLALANKETLVAAGPIIMPHIKRHGANLIPIDSEHSAIFQCLQNERNGQNIKRVVLTASGGPFRTWPIDRIENATVEEALNHPTWSMGDKITIDSASMFNKALELIEAHWLFGLEPDQLEVVVHPQSIIHSFVEFTDGSILAQLGPPDMRTPIQYALTYPDRLRGCSQALDWTKLSHLDFEPIDKNRFTAVSLAYEVIRQGGTAGATLNAANEQAVQAFLKGKILFGQIHKLVAKTLDHIPAQPIISLDEVFQADLQAREYTNSLITEQSE